MSGCKIKNGLLILTIINITAVLDLFGEAPLYITGFKGGLSMLTLLFSVVYISNNFFKALMTTIKNLNIFKYIQA